MRHPLRLPASDGTFRRFVAAVPGGSFAFVMATGIVSIAAALEGMRPIALLLLLVNLAAFPALCLLLLLRLHWHAAAVLADLRDHRQAPSLLTIVAGACLVGDQLSLLTTHRAAAAALWVGAAIAWVGLSYGPFALATRPTKPFLDSGLDGSWLLIVVAPQALAISAATASTAMALPEAYLFASLCLFALGTAFYLIVIALIVYRWLFWPMRPDQFAASYWINMGAAAITTLAGARLLPLVVADPALQPVRGFVAGATVVWWSLATWWIPLLCGLTLWRCRAGALGFRLENWSIVFPLGMYAVATRHFAAVMGLPFLAVVPRAFVWVALLAWCLTVAGMLAHLAHRDRGHDRSGPAR